MLCLIIVILVFFVIFILWMMLFWCDFASFLQKCNQHLPKSINFLMDSGDGLNCEQKSSILAKLPSPFGVSFISMRLCGNAKQVNPFRQRRLLNERRARDQSVRPSCVSVLFCNAVFQLRSSTPAYERNHRLTNVTLPCAINL